MAMTRGMLALAVAALAVVCLGALTITSHRTELLVGSYNVGRAAPGSKAAPQAPHGYGNQAAQNGFNPNFYNALSHAHGAKHHMVHKNLVGSKVVHPKGLPVHHPHHVPLSQMIGDQMKNSARKVKTNKLLVGSTFVDPKAKNQPPHPRGIGNEAMQNGMNPNFYNAPSHKSKKTQKLLVGSTYVDPKAKNQAPHPRGIGNQAMQNGFNPNFYNAPSRKAQKSKLLVGSFNVDPRAKNQVAHPGIGNQAAPQNHMDVGTNIVFHGVKSEGGIRGAKKHMQKKGLVGSYNVQRKDKKTPITQPHGYGDQSASRGNNPNFYNAPSH